MSWPRVTVCVCTRNRPEHLRRALDSLRAGARVEQVVVSDDSTDDRSKALVEAEYPEVQWRRGPGRGLGSNRNAALDLARGTHVLFLDDDAELGEHFLARCVERLSSLPEQARERTIVTGVEVHPDGRRVVAHEQDFLGFQRVPYGPASPLRTVVINSALFPSAVFREHRFDEQLVYGYDEVDLTSRAVRAGYVIVQEEGAVNLHRPSGVNRDFYRPFVESSRIYVTAKRRGWTEERPLAATGYVLAAAVHLAVAALRGGRVAPADVPRTLLRTGRMLLRHREARA